ncbi:MAG: hypothetical protein FWG73_07815 [Planctomycetaceae bacterium]|nr:hypothetical protein [Planctomycetaceae bacterium]
MIETDLATAFQLLQAGASFNIPTDVVGSTYVHHFLRLSESDIFDLLPDLKKDYQTILEWLVANGADIEGAKKDRERWKQGGMLSPSHIAELKKRYENELAVKQAAR